MDAVSGKPASAIVGQFALAWAAGAASDFAFVGGGAAWAAARDSWPRCAGHSSGWLLSAMVWQKSKLLVSCTCVCAGARAIPHSCVRCAVHSPVGRSRRAELLKRPGSL